MVHVGQQDAGGPLDRECIDPDAKGSPTVPSYLREPSKPVCWNCDQRADELVPVTLRTSSAIVSHFPLCRACDDAIYPALIHVTADAGIEIVRGTAGHRIAS